MQNVDVPNPDVSGLEDKHTPSPSSASISWPQRLSFAIPVPGEAADSSCLLRAASGLPALPEHRGAQERQTSAVVWGQREGTLPWHSQRHWSIRCCSPLEGNRHLQSLTNARHHRRDLERSQLKGDRGQALAHPRAGPQGAAAHCGLTAGERTPFLAPMRSGEEER